jgi:hypothetical protein
MVQFGKKHLHISESDQIVNGRFKAVKSVRSGSIKLEIATQPALKLKSTKMIISAIVTKWQLS